tara:strand:+ start:191 stop:859 length:669 start_codon:yes stop_codon:yes gene_type:complete
MNLKNKLKKMSITDLRLICKKLRIKCPKQKKDIVDKLLQPLGYKYKMFFSDCIKDDTCENNNKYSKDYLDLLIEERNILKSKSEKSDATKLKLLKIKKEICNIKFVKEIFKEYLNKVKNLLSFKRSDRKNNTRLESKEFIEKEEAKMIKLKELYPPNDENAVNILYTSLLKRFQEVYIFLTSNKDITKFYEIVDKMNKKIENCSKDNREINRLISHLEAQTP